MIQLPLFTQPDLGNQVINQNLDWLMKHNFDIRKRSYENDDAYNHRIIMSCLAFQDIDWPDPNKNNKWILLPEIVDICPTGVGKNRLPIDKRKLPPHQCRFLEMKDVRAGFWMIPELEAKWSAHELPKRATYNASPGDIFLSRFKEPLGKSVLYKGGVDPLYVSSNFLLLRSKKIDPLVLLALIKSSFMAAQLHFLIRRGSLIAEMYKSQANCMLLPALSKMETNEILDCAATRFRVEEQLLELENSLPTRMRTAQIEETKNIMCQMDMRIDRAIYQFLSS